MGSGINILCFLIKILKSQFILLGSVKRFFDNIMNLVEIRFLCIKIDIVNFMCSIGVFVNMYDVWCDF